MHWRYCILGLATTGLCFGVLFGWETLAHRLLEPNQVPADRQPEWFQRLIRLVSHLPWLVGLALLILRLTGRRQIRLGAYALGAFLPSASFTFWILSESTVSTWIHAERFDAAKWRAPADTAEVFWPTRLRMVEDLLDRRLLAGLPRANDPRVLKVESDEIVAAVKKKGIPVEYVLFDDEGRGFVKKENEIKRYTQVLAFLDLHLKGETTPEPLTREHASAVPPYRPGIDVLDYELTMDLPDTGNRIDGRAVLTVRRTAPVDSLVLDLLALKVDSVLLDGRPTGFARDSATIRIPLPVGSTDTFHVAVRYGGQVTDGLIIRTDSTWGWTAFGDNWPTRGRYWIPSVDHPSDKATVTWIVRAPSNLTVVANGTELPPRPIPGPQPARTESRWRIAEPIPVYLMVIAAAPLYRYDLGETACGLALLTRCVPQWVYVEPAVEGFLPGPFKSAAGIVAFYASLVGPYPYRKLAHLESSTIFGGMENATAIFYASGPFRTQTMQDGVIAYEIAHQWFGDAVTATEWPHLWLSEGFATYFGNLWIQNVEGDSAFRAQMSQMRQAIVSNKVVAERPVIDTIETDLMALLNVNSYQKGGFVLHMLRYVLGDSAFFGGLRGYQAKYRHGNALSDDLRRELEASSGMSLNWFFAQWLRRPGHAELTTSWTYAPVTRQVALTIEQGGRFGSYRFPLTVQIVNADGSTTRTDTQVEAQRITQITLSPKLAAPPRRLVFDPEVRLLATFAERATDGASRPAPR